MVGHAFRDMSSYTACSRGLSLQAGGGQLDLDAFCPSLCALTVPAQPPRQARSHPILVLGSPTFLTLSTDTVGMLCVGQAALSPQSHIQPYLCLPCQGRGGKRGGSPSSQHSYCLAIIIHHLEIQVLVVFPPLHLPS